MEQIKREMGDRALIVHKREYYKPLMFGLLRRRTAEVTAAIDVDQQERVNALVELGRRHIGAAGGAAGEAPARVDVTLDAVMPPPARDAEAPPRAAAAPSDDQTAREIAQLRQMLAALSARFDEWTPVVFGEPYDAVHRRLVLMGVRRDIANQLVAELSRQPPPDHAALQAAAVAALARMLPVSGPLGVASSAERGHPHTVALVGPTGMGKTTTLAKLAADSIVNQRRKVHLVTTDTYRMAALDQLQRYAEIMGLPMTVVYGTDEMERALAAARDADLILIDTAGCSQYNAAQLGELRAVLSALPEMEMHLVVAANTREQDMIEIAARFSALPLNRLLITKLDETTSYGGIVALVRDSGLPLSYLTTGQNVPEDIEVADSQLVAELVYGTRQLRSAPREERLHG